MGESGPVVLSPGVGDIKPLFTQRAHAFHKDDEISTPYVYELLFDSGTVEAGHKLTESVYSPVPGGEQPRPQDASEDAGERTRRDEPSPPSTGEDDENTSTRIGGKIKVAMTATSHVGLMQLLFENTTSEQPHVFVQATRQNWTGHATIDVDRQEISGSNSQRQDYALGPSRAPGFSGYFVSRFSHPFAAYGTSHGDVLIPDATIGEGEHLGAYAKFEYEVGTVEIRTGVSFVSVEQARRNLDTEAPFSTTFEELVETLKQAWLEKIGRVTIEGFNETEDAHDPRTIFYTSLFHTLQYPSDFSEPLAGDSDGPRTFYSGYTDSVHTIQDSYYQSWSIWDTFRAQHSLLTLFVPERVNSMMRSLVRIYEMAGRLPMWANMVESVRLPYYSLSLLRY